MEKLLILVPFMPVPFSPRITEPSGSPFADQSFTYDAAFNRSNWTLGTNSKDYTVNNLNQYTAIGTTTAPTYNTDGGLASYAGKSYVYDALGKLTEVDYSTGKTVFTYDPFGRRITKSDLNTSGTVLSTYQYHYDGGAVAVEYRPSVTWTYYFGVMRTDGTNNQYYYRDAQGSISAVADGSGNVLETYEYTAQGHFQITNGSGTVLTGTGIGNDILYAGERYDSETGNYYCNARYYNPVLGRFLNRDPLPGAEFSQGTNMYAYCGNDPVNEIDPSGMGWEWIDQGGSLAVGATHDWVKKYVHASVSAQVSTTGPQSTIAQDAWNNLSIGGRGSVPLIGIFGFSGSFSINSHGLKLSLGFGLVVGLGGSVGASTSTSTNMHPGSPVPYLPSALNATYQNSVFIGGNFGADPLAISPGASGSVNFYQGGGASANVYGPINGGASGSAGVQTTITIPSGY